MEGSVVKPQMPDTSKRSRSLDLKSIYIERSRGSLGKSRDNDVASGTIQESKVLKWKHESPFESRGSGFMGSRNKRSRKEVSLGSFNPAFKRRRNGPSRLTANGFVPGIGKRKNRSSSTHDNALAVPPAKDESNQALTVGNWEISNGFDGTLIIPKRPRGISRRKKSESSIGLMGASGSSTCSGKRHSDILTSRFSVDLVPSSRASIGHQDEEFDEFKAIGSNGASVKASRRKKRSRKLRVFTMETQTHGENGACLVADDQKPFDDPLDDDEENLEQNAARMLSSRFDPRCTAFLGNRKKSLKPANESSLQLLYKSFKGSGLGASSAHADGRAFRPRKHNGKRFARKRRHFYEVHYSNIDPYWVIKQRIKVFWPLDQTWYFGLVKNYDPVTKLHYVEYDDRDEEWINLQNERFKLLLFPSEVKFHSQKSQLKGKNKNEEGSIMESETIISWLARSDSRVKPSLVSTRKQRRNHLLKEFEPSISSASNRRMSVSPSSRISNKISSSCIVSERLIERDTDSRKLSFVYFRKRFRRREGLGEKPEGNSACLSSAGPMRLLASVADRESALEELYVSVTPTELKQITLKLSLPLQCIRRHAFGADGCLLFSIVLLHHGKLMRLWPRVHMEIIFVDSALGLRFMEFEGCLRWAIALVCLIMATFYQNKKCKTLSEMQAPYTSIEFNISGVHVQGGRFLFTLYSFAKLESTKWRYLEIMLKKHCMTRMVLPIEDCIYVNIKNLSSRRGQILCTSIFEDQFSFQGFPEKSCSDIMRWLILNRSACLNSEMLPPCTFSCAGAPSFFLSVHLKLLMENNAAVSCQKPAPTSSLDCPESYNTFTGKGCSPVEDSPDQVSEITSISQAVASSEWLGSGRLKVETDALSVSNDGDWVRSSHNLLNNELNMHARSPKTTAPRSICRRNRDSSVSPTFAQCSKFWQEDFIQNGFVNASRKPRTLVSYSSPAGDCGLGSEHRNHHQKGRFCKKIKTYIAKGISGGQEGPQSYLESSTCYANILVTVGDRGWRECGAEVVLDFDDQKDWRISVRISRCTKYVHKVHQFLQPGTTNRYTHAMMWKGGKDWALEFTDRSQWSLFKVMHEECLNRNIKAASPKSIPIPGVRVIDDGAKNITKVPFIRSSSKYHRQVGSEVDMALDTSHVLYDMGSDDEEWISRLKNSKDLNKGCKMAEVTDDMFERVIDMFEKIAYTKQCDRLTSDELKEFMAEFGPMDIIKSIHEHWWQKKQKKSLPLIRQFQPTLWEHYQQQLKEWDLAMSKMHNSTKRCQEKVCLIDKPPMFAFCLRPRGLEIPNEGSKQKSHRKLMFTAHHDSLTRDHDGLHAYGRKFNGLPAKEENTSFAVPNHEYLARRLQSPSSVLSKDAARTGVLKTTGDGLERGSYPKLHQNYSKKNGIILSDSQTKRYGVCFWDTDVCEWPSKTKQSQPDGFQRHQTDINEFRLRDPSSASQHASNMAKLKRERAQWLLHKADLAVHNAMVALTTAEAIKASQDLIGDG